MTIFVVPDLHGRTCWQEPAQQFLDSHGPTDQVVFLGDYVDSFEVSMELLSMGEEVETSNS